MINKKKLQSGLKIIAFIFPFIFIGPSLFLRGSMSGFDDVDSKNLIFLISGGITMLFALLGLFVGLRRILDAIFDKNSNE
ncbi:MAG: DUF6095 family protein [Bacteroidota bacterium]|nr:DUF6095 family protein [Bacteroidota bacterium]|tara:strand:+ start:469 stop:708 length:240 start_codon:yes stop_codon:yes gene_type:complete